MGQEPRAETQSTGECYPTFAMCRYRRIPTDKSEGPRCKPCCLCTLGSERVEREKHAAMRATTHFTAISALLPTCHKTSSKPLPNKNCIPVQAATRPFKSSPHSHVDVAIGRHIYQDGLTPFLQSRGQPNQSYLFTYNPSAARSVAGCPQLVQPHGIRPPCLPNANSAPRRTNSPLLPRTLS